ncbi:MAG: M23 family metallopeptidase [Gemmatimonadota bacterium]|nr:M23 family metallopeptidase [Gemmatimonadota bacterium]
MTDRREERRLSVVIVPHGGRESRTYHLSYRRLRWLTFSVTMIAVLLALMAGSWWYFAARAFRAGELERQVESMEGDRERVAALVQRLEAIEGQYDNIRRMFGATAIDRPSDVWLPPSGSARSAGTGSGERRRAGASPPSVWPLTERGFVTQELHDGFDDGGHPGLDVAVPSDSYIRAAGGGVVTDVGEDAVYGRFIVIEHGGGYTSLYGHASMTFVSRGQEVREREVVALSGSTGRSTGPHLHFEVLLDGEPIDPLTMVDQPS